MSAYRDKTTIYEMLICKLLNKLPGYWKLMDNCLPIILNLKTTTWFNTQTHNSLSSFDHDFVKEVISLCNYYEQHIKEPMLFLDPNSGKFRRCSNFFIKKPTDLI